MPNLPDPHVDDQGNDRYPPLGRVGHWSWPRSVLDGCATAWDRVHALRDQFDSQQRQRAQPSLPNEQELALARCIRRHGFPGCPDPGPNGTAATMPRGFSKPDLSAAAVAAIDACRRPNA